jgi:hypothetical protein
MTLPIPRSKDDLTVEWLSEALDLPVTGVDAVTIAEGAGFMGRLARVELTYAGGADGPASLVAKMPTDDPGGVALGQMLQLWEREARFYLDLRDKLPVRTPRCYYAGGDHESGIFAILLEDLSNYANGDNIAGASPRQAAAAIDWLAAFHAAEAGGGHAAALDWLPSTALEAEDPMYQGLKPMLEAVWPGFVEQFRAQAPGDTIAWVEALIPRFTEALGERMLAPTLVHSDFRADNLFFDGDEVITIDWQAVALGQGFYDVAYFLCGSLPTTQRRQTEHELVERYRRGLSAGGVEVPGPDEFFDLYRRTVHYAMAVVALLMAQLDFTVNARAIDLARLTVERFYTAGLDLQIGDFVGD